VVTHTQGRRDLGDTADIDNASSTRSSVRVSLYISPITSGGERFRAALRMNNAATRCRRGRRRDVRPRSAVNVGDVAFRHHARSTQRIPLTQELHRHGSRDEDLGRPIDRQIAGKSRPQTARRKSAASRMACRRCWYGRSDRWRRQDHAGTQSIENVGKAYRFVCLR